MDDLKIEIPKSRVYILIGKDNKLERIEGEYSLPSDLTDWVLYDEGYGDRYNLAQTHYLDKPLFTVDGGHQYKYDREEWVIVECSAEEIAEEISAKAKDTTYYKVGDYRTVSNVLYLCLFDNVGVDVSNTLYWQKTDVNTELSKLQSEIEKENKL